MIRDISSDTLLTTLVAARRPRWFWFVTAKVLVGTLVGVVTLWALLWFSAVAQGFQIKANVVGITTIQIIALLTSALIGMAASLLARTEARIYLFGSVYTVLLLLLSGMIADIDPEIRILAWLTRVFPLRPAMEILSDWMFFGTHADIRSESVSTMLALLVLSGAITFGSVLYVKRTL